MFFSKKKLKVALGVAKTTAGLERNGRPAHSGLQRIANRQLFEKEYAMKNLKTLTILAVVSLTATGALAFDLPTTAAVEVVEGITVAQVTGMDFGQVADHDGALVLDTDPAVAMTDAAFISFDPTGYTPGIFTVTSIIGASLAATFTDTDAADGLALGTFTVSLDAGVSDEANLATITQVANNDTWNVGCTLTVAAATATVGVQAVAYTMSVVLN
jgi:hypothetical protein